MKILIFSSIYPIKGTKSGFTPIVKYFCEDWVKLGHEVYVVSSTSKFPLLFYFIPKFIREFIESKIGFNIPNLFSSKKVITEENGVKIFQLPISKILPGKIVSDKVINKNVKIIENDFLLNFTPEFCIGHWVNPQIQYISYFKNKFNTKSAIVLHSVPNEQELYLLDFNIKNIDKIGFRSEKLVKPTLEKLNNFYTDSFICHSGVKDYYNLSENKYEIKLVNLKKIKICFIGNLISRKFPNIIIDAVNQVSGVDFEIHFIGSGYMEKEMKNIPLNKNVKVVFHGRLERKEVYGVLSECELLIMLSRNETFGLVYLEAMLNKTIPIASYNEGFDGIIQHKKNGFLGNAGSVNNLVQILKEYINMNIEDIYEIQQKAFETAVEMTDLKMAKAYLNNIIDENQK